MHKGENPLDKDALMADAMIIQQYQCETFALLIVESNPFGINNSSAITYDVIPKLFELHNLFTKFCEQLTELILAHGTGYVESLIGHYEYAYKNLLQLSINLDIIDEDITIEQFNYPFKLNRGVVDDYLVAIDIGGSLAKVTYTTPCPPSSDIRYCIDIYNTSCKFTYHMQSLLSHITKHYTSDKFTHRDGLMSCEGRAYNFPSGAVFEKLKNELMKIQLENGKYIAFKIFKNCEIDKMCQFILQNGELNGKIYTTGGMISKHKDKIEHMLNAKIIHLDEMDCVANGTILLSKIEHSLYRFDTENRSICTVKVLDESHFLVENVGSGTSIIKVSLGKNSRINGSSIGGGALVGSFHHLTNHNDFRSIQLSSECLYNLRMLQLNRSLNSSVNSESVECVKMLYNDLGALGQLTAKQYNIKTVIFTGFAICESMIALRTLDGAFTSSCNALFSYHGGFAGSLGALANALVHAC
ncbi:Fumble [Babesia microti strain RI]|uniref:Fumble n=1 Tax=Babesia microti (strain RI) TaxID=1133968 RepID=I7IQL3_BABMR|nr:Fumble [Babesia microti strain RI]CCF73880.1 Fumble [Babesia microti strain RI]|eukprot:XP_012648489.1 Fumble [Babesia microti strain RI]